jgi:hypothetical protein
MKKQALLTSAAMLLGLAALATPAAADIRLDGRVVSNAQINVTETLTKHKTVTIDVDVILTGDEGAEASAVHNQRTAGNIYHRNCSDASCAIGPNTTEIPASPGPVGQSLLSATISGSFNNNDGLVFWNQDVGANVNQAYALTAAVVGNAEFLEAINAVAQHSEFNTVAVRGFPGTPQAATLPSAAASIVSSVNNNDGVVMLNQHAGFASNQYNSMTLGLATSGANVALAESDLGQWNTGNRAFETNVVRTASMAGSVVSNSGVVLGNQSAGYFSNQANVVSIAAGF